MIWGIPESRGGNVNRKPVRLMLCTFFPIAILISLSACSSKVEALQTLDAKEITTLGNNCDVVNTGFVDVANTKDIEKWKLVFTDDIVYIDGMPRAEGIDKLYTFISDFNKWMDTYYPDRHGEIGETYISKDDCLGTGNYWGWWGFTQSDPGIEYDLLQTRDGKISYWRGFYNQLFFSGFGGDYTVNNDFLSQFTVSWSGGNTGKLMKIYANDAKLEDTLFGISISGQSAIRGYADSFFAKSPGASWDLISTFAEQNATGDYLEQHPFPSQGGVYAIIVKDTAGNPCKINVVVILTLIKMERL
jgi:hypothetical protein